MEKLFLKDCKNGQNIWIKLKDRDFQGYEITNQIKLGKVLLVSLNDGSLHWVSIETPIN